MAPPFISLLTDFGSRDPSGGILHGVIAGIAPEAIVVDISHEVAKFRVRDGALLLWCALPYLPIGYHVAVVDPGVGTDRRPVAVRTVRGDILVGPDNGILLPGAERLGGIAAAHLLEAPAYRLTPVSSSFHGRDIFAPAAAHLALGVPLESFGHAVEPETLVRLDWPAPDVGSGELKAQILYLDTFGNAKLGALVQDLHAALGPVAPNTPLLVTWPAEHGRGVAVPWTETFGRVPAGSPLLYEDSYGRLCLAVNQGSAASQLGLAEDQQLTIRRV